MAEVSRNLCRPDGLGDWGSLSSGTDEGGNDGDAGGFFISSLYDAVHKRQSGLLSLYVILFFLLPEAFSIFSFHPLNLKSTLSLSTSLYAVSVSLSLYLPLSSLSNANFFAPLTFRQVTTSRLPRTIFSVSLSLPYSHCISLSS